MFPSNIKVKPPYDITAHADTYHIKNYLNLHLL